MVLFNECILCDNPYEHSFGSVNFCNPCYMKHKSTIDPFTEDLREKKAAIQMSYKTIKMTSVPQVALYCLLSGSDEALLKIADDTLTNMLDRAEAFLQKVSFENQGRNIQDYIEPIIQYFGLHNREPTRALLELQLVVGDLLKEALRRKLPIAKHISFRSTSLEDKEPIKSKKERNEKTKATKDMNKRNANSHEILLQLVAHSSQNPSITLHEALTRFSIQNHIPERLLLD